MEDMLALLGLHLYSPESEGWAAWMSSHEVVTSLPFSKVQAFSVETAGTFDLDAELDLWFSGLGTVRFEFRGNVDLAYISRTIGQFVL